MNNDRKQLLPDLRFPEFVNSWKKMELGQLCDYWNGLSHENGVNNFGKYFLISLNSIDIDGNLKSDMKRVSYTDNSLNRNDLVMVLSDVAHGNFLGLTDIIPSNNYVLNQRMAGLRIKSLDKTDSYFLRSYINKNQNYFKKNGQGSSQLNLSKGSVTKFPILLPQDLLEQQKIASCLSSLDELITAQKEKLELLKNHKKGLMQNLFPQEGETVPKFRFPEFENDGEWKPTTVEKNCVLKGRIGYRGYTKEDLVRKGEGAIVLGGKHIQNQLLYLADPTFLSWEKYYESPEIMVEKNHIIFSQRGSLGDCAIIDNEIGKATINPSMVLMKNFKCDERFLYYVLIGEAIQREVARVSSLAAIPMLSQKQIKEFPFLIPLPKEQKKIAICLSFLDNLISAQTGKIERLQLHKKGLMQGLFPKVIDQI